MSCASSNSDLPERSVSGHGRPALLAPVVTQLVTQPELSAVTSCSAWVS